MDCGELPTYCKAEAQMRLHTSKGCKQHAFVSFLTEALLAYGNSTRRNNDWLSQLRAWALQRRS